MDFCTRDFVLSFLFSLLSLSLDVYPAEQGWRLTYATVYTAVSRAVSLPFIQLHPVFVRALI